MSFLVTIFFIAVTAVSADQLRNRTPKALIPKGSEVKSGYSNKYLNIDVVSPKGTSSVSWQTDNRTKIVTHYVIVPPIILSNVSDGSRIEFDTRFTRLNGIPSQLPLYSGNKVVGFCEVNLTSTDNLKRRIRYCIERKYIEDLVNLKFTSGEFKINLNLTAEQQNKTAHTNPLPAPSQSLNDNFKP